jgi:formylglycine-generating enzyme required for sulfatase activity
MCIGLAASGAETLPAKAQAEKGQTQLPDKRVAELKVMPLIEPAMVRIEDSFTMGKYEVTFDEYDRFAAQTGRPLPDDAGFGRGRRPVINVSWDDAVAYAQWLSAKTGKHFRLPTGEEWEQACGMETLYCGSKDINSVSWYGGNSGDMTHPVGEKQPNQHGLYDMSGNVEELTADCRRGDECGARMYRGSSWFDSVSFAHSKVAYEIRVNDRHNEIGFRLAQDLQAVSDTWIKQSEIAAQRRAEKEAREAHDKRIAELKSLPPIEPAMIQIGDSFTIGKYEVSFDEYDRFAAQTGRPLPDDASFGRGRRPVVNVSWKDAIDYTRWLSRMTGKPYYLPTEKQWELACGMQTEYCGGNDADAVAWHRDNSGGMPHLVGEKQPNAYGVYDMSGNVWEWTSDKATIEFSRNSFRNKSIAFVIRGGSWLVEPSSSRATNRIAADGDYRNDHLGFRVTLGR